MRPMLMRMWRLQRQHQGDTSALLRSIVHCNSTAMRGRNLPRYCEAQNIGERGVQLVGLFADNSDELIAPVIRKVCVLQQRHRSFDAGDRRPETANQARYNLAKARNLLGAAGTLEGVFDIDVGSPL